MAFVGPESVNPGLFGQFYDRIVAAGYFDYKGVIKALAKILKGREKILELGIGTGNVAIPLAKLGFKVSGVDEEAQRIHIFKGKIQEAGVNIKVRCKDGAKFSFPGKFDAVYAHSFDPFIFFQTKAGLCLDVNLDKPGQFPMICQNVVRHLKRNGLFVVNIERESDLTFVIGEGLRYERKIVASGQIPVRVHTVFRNGAIESRFTVRKTRWIEERARAEFTRLGFSGFTTDQGKSFFYCTYRGKNF